ncbi:MAG TPA: hypothetical protein VMZ74_01900 [Ramlibacter sp.]|nr:hypothetical protein [Ramlibacter sp.]
MHGAPSVSYPVGRSRFALGVLASAWLAGVAGLIAWRVQVPATPLQVLVAVAAVLVPGAFALRSWLRSPRGMLSWTGDDWTFSAGATESGSPGAVLDAQRVMLVRWSSGKMTRWLWLERGTQPSRWDDLRRAVYSRAPKP